MSSFMITDARVALTMALARDGKLVAATSTRPRDTPA
jgi:hypothetical protein